MQPPSDVEGWREQTHLNPTVSGKRPFLMKQPEEGSKPS